MLEAMMAQFSRAQGAVDYTDSFIVATQALLAAYRSIKERPSGAHAPVLPVCVRLVRCGASTVPQSRRVLGALRLDVFLDRPRAAGREIRIDRSLAGS